MNIKIMLQISSTNINGILFENFIRKHYNKLIDYFIGYPNKSGIN